MSTIDFLTFIIPDSNYFANFLRKTGELTKSGKHKINWKCVLSNSASIIPDNFECITYNNNKSSNPSIRHAAAIHEGIKKSKSDYIIIADIDISLMYKNWDDIIIHILDSGYSCFGTPNSSNSYGETDFPNVPFFCFKKEIIKKINLNFYPIINKDNKKLKVVKPYKNKKLTGRGIANFVFFDTGCQLSTEFKKHKLKSKCLKIGKMTSTKSKFLNNTDKNFKQKMHLTVLKNNEKFLQKQSQTTYHKFVEYSYNDRLFLTHFGGCRFDKKTSLPRISWEWLVKDYLKKHI